MASRDPTRLATLIVVSTGALWGLYWMPVRRIDAAGLEAAWGTLAIVAAATLVLLVPTLRRPAAFKGMSPGGALFLGVGGLAFVLYSVGLVAGRVAIITLLFYLTPVWSVIIGRLVLGTRATGIRLAAIGIGLLGLAIMLGADGTVPVPRGLGEWMALAAGVMWAVASTGIRLGAAPDPVPAAFVFAVGGTLSAAVLAPVLSGAPDLSGLDPAAVLGWSLGTGALWWGVSIAALMWATARLDPARVGILLMSEVLVGAASAAVFAGEVLSVAEILGGALVLAAGVLEVWPERRRLRR